HHPPVNKLPAPVFANAPHTDLAAAPDSTFTVRVERDGTFQFTAGDAGFYHFRADTAGMTGYTLFVPTESYPIIGTAADMLPPLRYITSMKEWERLSTAAEIRQAVEEFWTDAAGSRDRAREAIAGYYG